MTGFPPDVARPRTTAEGLRVAGGTCAACGYVVAVETATTADRSHRCGCGHLVKLTYVIGTYNGATPCDDRCQYATRNVCSCSCGGENHRRGYIHAETVPGEVRDRDWLRHAAGSDRANARERAARESAQQRRDAMVADTAELGELLGERYAASTSDFVLDMRRRIAAGEPLSDRQTAAVVRIVRADADRDAARVQRQRADAAALAAGVRVPTGQMTFTGLIVSAKVHTDYAHSYHGTTTVKVVVRHADGWAAWGTLPRSAYPPSYSGATFAAWVASLPGQSITLTATITGKPGDPLFGFFKRPKIIGDAPCAAVGEFDAGRSGPVWEPGKLCPGCGLPHGVIPTTPAEEPAPPRVPTAPVSGWGAMIGSPR